MDGDLRVRHGGQGAAAQLNTPTDHYFSAEPRAASTPATVTLHVGAASVELVTDAGVFAHGHVDRGTDLLVRTVPAPPAEGALLDVGCGYGAIAIALALRAPEADVWAVDVNRRALELCRRNAERAGAVRVHAVEPDGVPPAVRFAAMYSNPPVRIGKDALHSLLEGWLARVDEGGHAYLVVHRHLGSDSLARRLTEQGHEVTRMRSRMGYRVLDVRPSRETRDDGPG